MRGPAKVVRTASTRMAASQTRTWNCGSGVSTFPMTGLSDFRGSSRFVVNGPVEECVDTSVESYLVTGVPPEDGTTG